MVGMGSIILPVLLVILYVGLFVFFIRKPKYFGEYTACFKADGGVSTKYYCLVMIERMIIGLSLVILLKVNVEAAFPLAIFLTFGILVAVKRPYRAKKNNIRVVANMGICVFV